MLALALAHGAHLDDHALVGGDAVARAHLGARVGAAQGIERGDIDAARQRAEVVTRV